MSIVSLYDICFELCAVENGLAEGRIRFSFDNLMCAMKPGHPADILDDIFSEVGNTVICDPDARISLDVLESMYKELKGFKTAFKVKEMNKPLKELKAYIEAQKEA